MPQAGPDYTLPRRVYETLKAGFTASSADWLIRQILRDRPGQEPRVLHLGDPFGRVFAWVWHDDQDQAMLLLADLLAELRNAHPRAGEINPPIRLDEVLGGLRLALPHGFDDYQAVVDKARQEVQGYYGADPNA
jgi:hypothetical protein